MEEKKIKKGDNWKITLLDSYEFEGETVEMIDLNGLFDLTGKDLARSMSK